MQIFCKIKSPVNRVVLSLLLSAILFVGIARTWVQSLRPVQILPLMAVLQLALLVHFSTHLNIFFYLAGNLAAVCAAIAPITIPRQSIHWVK